METLFDLLRLEGAELTHQFQRASISGKGTPQEVAEFREHAVQDFVGRFFPFPYRIAKGNIRDAFGESSDSIDCILCNPAHPHTIDSQGKFQLILADGVDAAIEVKPDISDRSELERGLKQGLSVKRLRRSQSALIHTGTNTISEKYAFRVPYALFAMTAKSNPLDTGREILQYYSANGTERLDQADLVVVNNVGLFVNIQIPRHFPWSLPWPDAQKVGWFFAEWRDQTLVGFLMHLHLLPHARMKVQEDLLLPYLKQAKFVRLIHVGTVPSYDPAKSV